MAGIEIIGLPYTVNGPPASTYEQLYNGLAPYTGSGYVIINGYGEAVGPGSSRAWTPQAVGQWVAAGNHWIDWCGYPFYYQGSLLTRLVSGGLVRTSFETSTLGPAGWRAFATAAGWGGLRGASFLAMSGRGYELDRGWPTTLVQVPGVEWPTGLTYHDYEGNWAVVANGWSALLGLQTGQGGWYFYVARNVGLSAVTIPLSLALGFIRPRLTQSGSSSPPATTGINAPSVTWGGVAGSTTTASSGGRVTWQFALPTGWRWSQAWDTANPTPQYTTTSGYLAVAGLSPGVHQVVLRFFAANGATADVRSPTVTIVSSGSSTSPVCPSGYTLVNGVCVPATSTPPTSPSCPSGYTLVNGVCIPQTSSSPSPLGGIPWGDVAWGAAGVAGLGLAIWGLGRARR